jgi:hypothetical protein
MEKNFHLTRKSVIQKAYDECLTEMYAKAQPPLDYMDVVRRLKNGEEVETKLDPIYQRHYLSQYEFHYILDKYIEAYGMSPYWKDSVETVEEYLKKGGLKTVYKDDGKTTVRTPKLVDEIGEENAEKVFALIKDCKDFYRFDREESDFSCAISLGCSPMSNKERVIQYWKEHGKDITIEDREPDTLWYRDEFGDDWKDVYDEERGLEDEQE